MSRSDRDDELEDLLAQRATLHQRLSECDGAEPPAELDRLVLTNAREAVEASAEARVYRSPRWALPAGLAAVVLLSLAALLNLGQTLRTGAEPAAPASAPEFAPPPAAPLTAARSTAPRAVTAPVTKASASNGSRRSDPQAWLREIEQLRAAGRIAEADRELEAFRKVFPRHSGPMPAQARPPVQ